MNLVKGPNALAGFALGVVTTVAFAALWDARAGRSSALGRDGFREALDTVLERYVDPVNEPELLAGALDHVVAGLDPHSHYLTADERKALRRRSRGGHTGLAVVMHTGDCDTALGSRTRPCRRAPRPAVGQPASPARLVRWLEVVAVEPGSPADEAGISPGDHILELRDRPVADLSSQIEVDASLVGSVGESISLRVQRRSDPKPQRVELRLSPKSSEPIKATLVEGGDGRKVAHVLVRAFRSGTGERVKKALASLERSAGASGVSGIVLDVRSNPGGEVDEALVVADLFVAGGILTRTRGRGGRVLREEKAHAVGTDERTPLVVLQDRHSASAAELLAVALSEHGRATLVGERSYGKGTVQEVHGLPDGSLLTLTIARYHSPRDHVIEGRGVAPDVRVQTPGAPGSSPDRGLEAALRVLGAALDEPSSAPRTER
jgi:carboxyl-terminal processing protease